LVLMLSHDFSSWSSCQMSLRSMTVSSTKLTTRAVLSTPVDKTREEGLHESRSHPAVKQISPKTGAHIGSM
jgi:hypothetical protein